MDYGAGSEAVTEYFEVPCRYDAKSADTKPIARGTFGYVAQFPDLESPPVEHEGANGETTKAPKLVAIKKIPALFLSQRHWTCATRELHMMRWFDHPNVMTAIDLFVAIGDNRMLSAEYIARRRKTFDEVYIVMDHMEMTLRAYLDSLDAITAPHPFPTARGPKTVVLHPVTFEIRPYLLFQLVCGLGYLHRSGVVHRDMKPENVLMDLNWNIRICDFGQGRGTGTADAVTTMADTCTQWYAAPETLTYSYGQQSLALIDRATFHSGDVWSLGCLAAEMLVGRPLFETNERGGTPQLRSIINLLGQPSEDDIRSIGRDADGIQQIRSFLQGLGNIGPSVLKEHLRSPLPDKPSPEEVDLIMRMLHYDPRKRITTSEVLQHPFFANYTSDFAYLLPESREAKLFPFVKKSSLPDEHAAREFVWNLFTDAHPEVNELERALLEEKPSPASAAAASA